MSKKHKISGLAMGVTECLDHGHPFITFDIGGKKAHMVPENALIVYDQLGMLLGALGIIDGDEVEEVAHVTH